MAQVRTDEDRLLLDSMVMAFCETYSFAGVWKPTARTGPLRQAPGRYDFETAGSRILAHILAFVGMLAAITLATGLTVLTTLALEAEAPVAAFATGAAAAMILILCVQQQRQDPGRG